MKNLAGTLFLLALLGLASVAQAQTIAVNIERFDSFDTAVNGMRGWRFTVNSPVTLTELGLFDDGSNGLAQSHRVGVWDNSGNLLTDATITNASTAAPLLNAGGNWLFEPVTPLPLGIGDYIIAGQYGAFSDKTALSFNVVSVPEVTYVNGVFALTSAFTRPTNDGSNLEYFGPTFRILSPPTVPEPGSVALLVGLGTVGVSFLRKRRNR